MKKNFVLNFSATKHGIFNDILCGVMNFTSINYAIIDTQETLIVQYDFRGQKDLVKFIKLVAEAGLYAHLRIGPYVCAEWNYG